MKKNKNQISIFYLRAVKALCFLLMVFHISTRAQSVGGFLSTSATVCAGLNSGVLSVSNYVGSILRWEFGSSINGPWATISHVSNFYSYQDITQTTFFRVIVQQSGFPPSASNAVGIYCDAPSIAGSISTPTLQCLNGPVTITLTGNNSNVIVWEYTSGSWLSKSIFTTNVQQATYPVLSNSVHLRASVRNGVCPQAFSNSITVVPANASSGGTISGTSAVCSSIGSASLSLAGSVGNVNQWEWSASSQGFYTAIPTSTNTSLTISNLTQSVFIRTQVQNANCAAVYSNTHVINVWNPSAAGSIVGTSTACAASNTGTLQLQNYSGNTIQWQSSVNGNSWSAEGSTTATHNFSNLNNNMMYRALVQNGVCAAATSPVFTVQVFSNPTASFSAGSGCTGSNVQFANLSIGASSYLWDFGDSYNSFSTSPSHSFSAVGVFTVQLKAVSTQGCRDSLSKLMTVNAKPGAAFVAADTTCFGSSMVFINSSSIASGSISQVLFNFGDGTGNQFGNTLNHFFPAKGNYQVKLKVTSNFGCSDSIIKSVQVFPKPNSSFVSTNPCLGNNSSFSNLSTVSPGYLRYLWRFGNSASSSFQSPTYSYSVSGQYSVSLICFSEHNCTDTMTKTVYVHAMPDFTFSVSNSCVNSQSSFGALSNNALNTNTLYFGDGSFGSLNNPYHSYNQPGIYYPSLKVMSDSGCVKTQSYAVTIFPKPKAAFISKNGCKRDSIEFINLSTINSGSFTNGWNFGSTGSDQHSPKHSFDVAGEYSVTLITLSDKSCADTLVKTLRVYSLPESVFNFSSNCSGVVTFSNNSTSTDGKISNTFWSFGDDGFSEKTQVDHEYKKFGEYEVALITESEFHCRDTSKMMVRALEKPRAAMSVADFCIGERKEFINQTFLSTNAFKSRWDFGDGKTSSEAFPLHKYLKPGQYLVQLHVSTEHCSDSVEKLVHVHALPQVNAGKDTSMEKGTSVQLEAGGATSYSWISNGFMDSPVVYNPIVSPEETTNFIVFGVDAHGCMNTDTVQVRVTRDFKVTIYDIVTPNGNGMNDRWVIKNIEAYPDNHVVIFDKWNQKVYEKEIYNGEWEGRNQAGEMLPDGTYYYLLSFYGSDKHYSGYLTLVRNTGD